VQRVLPAGHADTLEPEAGEAEGIEIVVPAQGLRVMQVEHVSPALKSAAVEREKTREKIHRHQVIVHRQARQQTQLQRALEHQHQAVLLGLAHPVATVETDVSRAMNIHPGALRHRAADQALGNPFGQVVTVLDVQRQAARGGRFEDVSCGVHSAACRQRRDEIAHLLASGFTQAQAFQHGFDVIPGQCAVVQHMVDLRGVVYQCTKAPGELVVHRVVQA